MPLLWKHRKKRKPKRVPTPPESPSDNNVIMDTPPEEDKNVVFAMVVQDFVASICDELTVHRGQMIQPLFNNGTWLYVKDVDGKCGYVPAHFCQTIDQVKDGDGDAAESPKKPVSRSRSIHEVVEPRLHSSTGDSQPASPAVAGRARRASSPAVPSRLLDESLQPNGHVPVAARQGLQCSQYAAIKKPASLRGLDSAASPVLAKHHTNQVLHPLHPSSFVQQHEQCNGQGRQSSSNSDAVASSSVLSAQSPNAYLRNYSYKQAVVSVNEKLEEEGPDLGRGLEEERPAAASRMVPMTHQPACRPHIYMQPLRPSTLPLYDRLEGYQQHDSSHQTTTRTTTDGQFSYLQSELVDDVFLPTMPKPVGIFKSISSYSGSAEGEVSVSGNEYVIVTNLGCGEWAMVITAGGREGLLPRKILTQYLPMDAASSVATQTELVIVNSMTPDSTTSRPSTRRRNTVVCIREVHANHPQTAGSRNTNDMCIQTEPPAPPSPLDVNDVQEWINSQPQSLDDLWYENSMSLPRLGNDESMSFLDGGSSIHTLPVLNGLTRERGTAPRAFHSSRESLPQLPFVQSPHTPHCNGFFAETPTNNLSNTPTTSYRHHYLDAMATPTAESDGAGTPSSVSIKPQMVLLVGTKDFVPSQDTPNCLLLKKGDFLYLYPGNNVQRGWIWAYHTGTNSFGFVPKSCVAFMYPGTTSSCRAAWQNNHFVIEEEV